MTFQGSLWRLLSLQQVLKLSLWYSLNLAANAQPPQPLLPKLNTGIPGCPTNRPAPIDNLWHQNQ
jgi:hypothetical protein